MKFIALRKSDREYLRLGFFKMAVKPTKAYFDKHVKTNNPYDGWKHFAFITWAGMDYSEWGSSPEYAKQVLWETLNH